MPIGFGTGAGAGVTDALQTAYAGRATQRTYFVRMYALGYGGGGAGAVFRSAVGTSSVAMLGFISSGASMEVQFGFSGTNGAWTFPTPALSAWHTIAITYDGSSTANNPTIYVDGASVVVTRTVAPVGTFGTTSNAYFIGNNALTGGVRNWDGLLQDLAIWDSVIPAAELPLLHAGFSPLQIHPETLVEYLPLRRNTSSVKAGAVSVTGTLTSPVSPLTRQIPVALVNGEAPSTGATVVVLSTGSRSMAGAAGSVLVSANGTLAGSVTVTPSDGGDGGTFSPTSVTISPGTPTASVSYTPATAGLKSLSTTNTGGLGDASGVAYKADSTVYYISAAGSDSASGISSATPWATIAQVMSWGLVRGATYHFRGGDTFSGQIALADGNSGATLGQQIAFESYGTGKAILQGPSSTDGAFIATDTGGWRLTNLELVGSGSIPATANQNIVYLNPAGGNANVLQNISITQCRIRNGRRGIYIRGDNAASQKLATVDISNNEISACWDRAINVGMLDTVTGVNQSWVTGLTISYNNIYDINDATASAAKTSFGIVTSYCDQPQIHHNVIHDIALNSTNGGCGYFCWGNTYQAHVYRNEVYNVYRVAGDGMGLNLDSGSRECLVELNYVHDCEGGGLACYEFQSGSKPSGVGPWRDNVFRYNVVQDCGKSAFGAFGVIGDDMVGCDVYGNTFVHSSTVTAAVQLESGALGAGFQATNISGFRFRNNVILAASNAVKVVRINTNTGVSAAGFDFEGNSYFPVTGAGQIRWFGTDYNTVAAWGVDATAVTADPLLSDPFNVTVFNDTDLISTLTKVTPGAGSPLRNAGLDLKGSPYNFTPTTDFKGGPLPASGAMDIGALDADAPQPDITAPTLAGSITVGVVTSTSIAITWPAGADNVAVTSYEVNRGAGWVDTGSTSTSYTFTGLTANTAYTLQVRAKDAAGNVSTPVLSASQSTSAAAPVSQGSRRLTLPEWLRGVS